MGILILTFLFALAVTIAASYQLGQGKNTSDNLAFLIVSSCTMFILFLALLFAATDHVDNCNKKDHKVKAQYNLSKGKDSLVITFKPREYE